MILTHDGISPFALSQRITSRTSTHLIPYFAMLDFVRSSVDRLGKSRSHEQDTPVELQSLIEGLSDPAAYEPASGQPVVRQTHISVVFLTSELAYKIKKPVRLRFLDYSSLALRRHFCEEEVRLNRRLAPGVYLGVVPVTWDGVRLHVEQPGSVVEWAVKMRRLPEEATLSAILDREEPSPGLIEKLAARIAAFHAAAKRSPEIAALCRFDGVAGLVQENLKDAASLVGSIIDAPLFRRLEALTEKRLLELQRLFDERALRGIPCDAHGDLRLEHVYLFPQHEPPGDIVVVDCIEFDHRLRALDPVSDMAFLAMELLLRGREDLAGLFCRAYFSASGDAQGAEILPFYVAYRAMVRAKVEALKAKEPEIASTDRNRACASAMSHWMLAIRALEDRD